MDKNFVLKVILFSIVFSAIKLSAVRSIENDADLLANTVKVLLHSIGRSGRLTAMGCWNKDISRRFYQLVNTINELQSAISKDFTIAISNTDFENIPESYEEHYEFILVDINCNNVSKLFYYAKERLITYAWIIFDSRSNEENAVNVLEYFQELSVLPKAEIYYLNHHRETNTFHVEMFYCVSLGQPLIVESVGIIEKDRFIDYRETKVISRRRQNLRGINLKASIVITNNDTLNHLNDYRNIEIDPISKVNHVLTAFLMSYLNATVIYSIVPTWGYKNDETGEWSGMVGELVRNEVELGVSPLFMTVERVSLIQYISMPTPTGSRFVFRSPKLSYTDNVFLLPFDDFVWFCLIGLVITTATFLIFTITIEWKYVTVNSTKEARKLEEDAAVLRPSVVDVFFVVFGAVCQQGSSVTPRSATSRIITIVAFTILMFLYTSYSANIVALLQSPSTRIKSLKDLYESRLEIGVDDTVFNRYFFAHAVEPIRQKIYEQKVLRKDGKDNFMTLEEGVKRVRKGLFAFHMELALGYKLMSETFFEDEKCGIKEIAYLQVTDPWYAIKKNSSYKENFKIGMMRMHEHGLQERENSRMYTKKPRCVGQAGGFITASLVDTKPALMVLLFGFLFAFCVLVTELLVHYGLKRRQRSNLTVFIDNNNS